VHPILSSQVGYHLTTFSATIDVISQLAIKETAGVEFLLRKKKLSEVMPQK
jgi:hypothetical protein